MAATEMTLSDMPSQYQPACRTILERFEVTEQSAVALLLLDALIARKFDEAVEALKVYGKGLRAFTGADHFSLYRELDIKPH